MKRVRLDIWIIGEVLQGGNANFKGSLNQCGNQEKEVAVKAKVIVGEEFNESTG